MVSVKKRRAKGDVIKVNWNEMGQPIGKQSMTLAHFVGSCCRRTFSITITNWRKDDLLPLKEQLWDEVKYLNTEVDRVKKENDSMQIELRHLKGEDITSLHPKELIPIEAALQHGLTKVIAKQTEYFKMMKKKERMLEEENKHLSYILHQQQGEMDGNLREMENGYQQPDWDMFHSLHPMAEYHGAARAIGGCAIYVSDKPGHHDFNLLKKLVLPDGSILRAKLPGRPTRDCRIIN